MISKNSCFRKLKVPPNTNDLIYIFWDKYNLSGCIVPAISLMLRYYSKDRTNEQRVKGLLVRAGWSWWHQYHTYTLFSKWEVIYRVDWVYCWLMIMNAYHLIMEWRLTSSFPFIHRSLPPDDYLKTPHWIFRLPTTSALALCPFQSTQPPPSSVLRHLLCVNRKVITIMTVITGPVITA